MATWQEAERVLRDYFRREGWRIKDNGDVFAESDRGACQMAIMDGTACVGIGKKSINLTTLAREIEAE